MCRLGLRALRSPSRAQAVEAVSKASNVPGPGLHIFQALAGLLALACIRLFIYYLFSILGPKFLLKLDILFESASTNLISC